ncbi:hypothetical protein [Mycobacterium sp. IDR2000157661]|uniref:hypothetical protein n=1 Tax=Mycobacterium sp. IDR2000157661 TaxID=2867005 RepID=UPI001EEB67DB|nr:hypothetical protein [Mycobacterium sp. IDR2000157661]ULE32872.1 hypothetical protein K3G64_22835 [Mycobacterium sp. IDR2000157661]
MTHPEDEYDESDTTAEEFNAMWERATPTKTVVRQMHQARTSMAPTEIRITAAAWTRAQSETSSAYARAATG